jgi:hypothetical protein
MTVVGNYYAEKAGVLAVSLLNEMGAFVKFTKPQYAQVLLIILIFTFTEQLSF